MKKLNVNEKRERSVLVQKIDIKKLSTLNIPVPSGIFHSFVFGNDNITFENQYDFVEFFDEDIFNFFINQDWILDYDTYNYFSLEELSIAKRVLSEELIKLDGGVISNLNDSINLKKMHDTKNELEYMIESIEHLIQVKFNEIKDTKRK